MSHGAAVSVVLPAYNEADTIEDTVSTALSALSSFLPAGSFEVLVAEDGCEDRTPEIAARLAESDERVRHVHSEERLGRGGALDLAFRHAAGDTLVYFDTDLATDMRHLEELVESVRSGEYDLATGSRWVPGERAQRPARRGVPSRGFNWLVRTLLGSDIRDHQCGFKAVSRDAYFRLAADIEDEHWFWDTELLVRAQRAGLSVREFPVEWTPKGDSKVDLVRDVFGMGSQILRCWWEFAVSPRVNQRTGIAVGLLLSVLAVALMFLYLPVGEVLTAIGDADPALVAGAAVVYLFSWPLRGVRYRDILDELGYPSETGFLTGAIFISQTGNLVIPARAGDAVRAYVMKARRNVPYASGFASLAIERVFDLLTITVLAGSVLLGLATIAPETIGELAAAVGAEGLSGRQQTSVRRAVVVAGGVGAVAVGAVVAIVASARSETNYARRVVEWASDDSYVEYVAGALERFVGDIQTVAGEGRAFARVGTASLLIWSLDVVTAIVVFAAFGPGLPTGQLVAVCFFAVSVGNLAKVVPGPPGGIGLYEAAFTVFVLALTPVTWNVAFAVAIVDHAVKNVITVLGGAASMVRFNVSLTEAVSGSREVEERSATAED
jgi:uncharacterized membrane protein YbhN (UPF0104 family)